MAVCKLILFLTCLALSAIGSGGNPIDLTVPEEVEMIENSNLLQLLPFFKGVEQSRASIKDVDDLIRFLESLRKDEITEVVVPVSVEILQSPLVKKYVNGMLEEYPQVGEILEGVVSFLNGPQAEPLMAVVRPAFKSIVEAGKKFVGKIQEPLKEFSDVVTQEGVTAYIMAQTPMVLEVFDKFLQLPEMELIDPKVLSKMKVFIDMLKKNSIAPK